MRQCYQSPVPLLSLPWRRRFVVLFAAAAAGLLVIQIPAGLPAHLRHSGTIVCLVLTTVALWFLADAVRPWLAPANDSTARALRLEAASRSHTTLIWLAASGWFVLSVAAEHPTVLRASWLAPAGLCAGIILIGLSLPMAFVSWLEPESERTLTPSELILARFGGPESSGHRVAAATMLLSVGLLALASDPERLHSPVGRILLMIALPLIVAGCLRIGWLLLLYDRQGGQRAER